MKDALCKDDDPRKYFPERGQSYKAAQFTCFHCTVRRECKEYSERIGAEYGVWGGAIKRRQEEN